MAEAMEVDSVLAEKTNSDNINSTKSDASVLQENTDKPASVLQEKSTEEPLSSSVLQKTTNDEPTSALQEKTTDKPQIPQENLNKYKPLIEENNSPKPESSETTDSTNHPNIDATPLQKTMEEPKVSLEKVCETELLVENTPNQQPNIETRFMDKHAPQKRYSNQLPESTATKKQKVWPTYPRNMVFLIAKHTYNLNKPNMSIWAKMKLISKCQILIFKPIPKSWSHPQMINLIKNHVRCFSETNERFCTFTFVRDLTLKRTGECLVRFKSPEYCHKAWCDLRGVRQIENTPISVDLDLGHTRMTKVKRYNKLNEYVITLKRNSLGKRNVVENQKQKTATEELKVGESPIEQVKSSKNESVNPQIEGQNNSSDLSANDSLQQETLIAQSNSGVEPENVYEGEPKENEPLEVAPKKINQNNKEDVSTIEQNNLKDVPDKINQNIEEDVPMKECNANESDNTPTVSTGEPKADQSNNSANKTELKATTTQNNFLTKIESNRKHCSTCFKFHPEPCWKAQGPQRRDSDQSSESPAKRVWLNYPADMVSLIGRHTYDPNISKWTKMKLIRVCEILSFKPIPTSWTRQEMMDFLKKHVRFMNEKNVRVCSLFFVLDEEYKQTGEWLVKFRNSLCCHKAWCDMRDVKIENTPISVDLDLGHNRMKQARRINTLRINYLKSFPPKELNSLGTSNDDEIQEQKSQGNENDASNSNGNGSSAGNNSSNENAANSTAAATGPNNSVANSAGTSNETQNYNKNNNLTVKSKPSFMPPEKFNKTTYGLNEVFLQSLGLNLPLRNDIVVLGLEHNLSDDKIKEIFSLAGTVKRAFRVKKKDGGPTMKGIVEYDHPIEAVQAVSMFNCQQLYGRTLAVKMGSQAFPRPLPEGLSAVGPGLGFGGEPMRGVRAHMEVESLKKMLTDFKNMFNSKIAGMEQSIASLKKAELEPHRKVPTPLPQAQSTDTATQLVNALSSLTQPNLLMGLTTLLSAQGLAQQGLGTDQAAMANQMMWQNAGYAQNINMQGMQQPTLSGAFPQPNVAQPGLTQPGLAQPGLAQPGIAQPGLAQPGLAQPGLAQPGLAQPGLAQPGLAQPGLAQPGLAQPGLAQPGLAQPGLAQPQIIQPLEQSQMYYGQPQMMQPGFMPTVPPPAPGASVPQMNQQSSTSYPNQPQQMASQQPSTSYSNQPQPIATKQQTHAYIPKVSKNKGSSKNQTTNSNWNTAPVAALVSQKRLKQKAAEPKPAYSSEQSYYKRPSRFDMKEKPNLTVIVPEPEKKEDDLLAFSNLPPSVSIEALNSKMREVGDVMFGEMTGRGRALVRFRHVRDAERCFKLFNRSKVDGQVITVEYL